MDNDLSHLPGSVQKLIALIGLPLTLRMVEVFGGTTLYLYRSEACVQKLSSVVGAEAAQKIISFFGNTPVTIATCKNALVTLRNRDILARFDHLTMVEKLSARASVLQIVKDYTPPIHERTIWRVLKKTGQAEPVDPRQQKLF
ncbi:hypothetical protein B0920_02155 [Massilia sp. KIM]|uniref:hypothetical protein n=1 Tax=Massilia sp. KIM TaxID=1955422 RepID=UPI00098F2073|nr:hypothetical protein [Massilia sp. KIM]OON62303.1 hypothetical protein B0920_02155 [Massilia sp. KIM]